MRENRRTFPEINKIVVLNKVDKGSRMMGKLIWWMVMVKRFHSSRIILALSDVKSVRNREGIEIVSRRRGANKEMGDIA